MSLFSPFYVEHIDACTVDGNAVFGSKLQVTCSDGGIVGGQSSINEFLAKRYLDSIETKLRGEWDGLRVGRQPEVPVRYADAEPVTGGAEETGGNGSTDNGSAGYHCLLVSICSVNPLQYTPVCPGSPLGRDEFNVGNQASKHKLLA